MMLMLTIVSARNIDNWEKVYIVSVCIVDNGFKVYIFFKYIHI